NIQRSVNELFFKKGFFKMGDVTASLTDVNFTGGVSNKLHAGNVQVKNKNDLDINANGVDIRSMIIDDDIQHTTISGIKWNKADIRLSALPGRNKKNTARFTLANIEGANTTIHAAENNKKLSLFLQTVK